MPRGLSPSPGILSSLFFYPCSSKRLVTLARGLSPAFLRFGGKRTDFLQFQNLRNPAKSRGGPGPDYYLKNYEDGEKLASHSCGGGGEFGEWAPAFAVGVCGGADLEESLAEASPQPRRAGSCGRGYTRVWNSSRDYAKGGSPYCPGSGCRPSAGLLGPEPTGRQNWQASPVGRRCSGFLEKIQAGS